MLFVVVFTELFHPFSLDYFLGCVAHKTRRLMQTHCIQGNSLFSVISQETRDISQTAAATTANGIGGCGVA